MAGKRVLFFIIIGLLGGAVFTFAYVRTTSTRDIAPPVYIHHETRKTGQLEKPGISQVEVPVLMYHYIRVVELPQSDELGFRLSVTPQDFENQLLYLQQNGYQTITPDEFYAALEKKQKFGFKPVLLTFDDGYEDFYTTAFPILKKYNLKATIFVVPGFISEPDRRYLTWEQLRELDQSGLVTIASHTMHHVDVVTNPEANKEISESQQVLQKFLGHEIDTFAYPGGTFDNRAEKMVDEAGYKLAFTTRFGIWHDFENRFAISRVRVSGGLDMKKFAERVQGRISATAKRLPTR